MEKVLLELAVLDQGDPSFLRTNFWWKYENNRKLEENNFFMRLFSEKRGILCNI